MVLTPLLVRPQVLTVRTTNLKLDALTVRILYYAAT